MPQLYILRHAKAVPWSPETEDFPRHLSAAGESHASRLARWIRDNLESPQCILCSPSHRTRETLAPLLCLEPRLEAVTHFVPQLYLATRSTLNSLLDAAFAESDYVLMVGHNPGLEYLTHQLIHPRHNQEFTRLPTGTLAVVDFDERWPPGDHRGRLTHFVRGKQLSVD